MNLATFIKKQNKSKNPKKTKLHFLISVSELLLMPTSENLRHTIKYLSILANTYHIPTNTMRPQKIKDIDNVLLNKTSEIILNGKGYAILIPETFKIIVSFAKNKGIKLTF